MYLFLSKLSHLFVPVRSICNNFSTLVVELSWDLKYEACHVLLVGQSYLCDQVLLPNFELSV